MARRARLLPLVLLTVALAGDAAAQHDPLAPVAERARAGDAEGALRLLAGLPEGVRRSGRARYLRGRLLERTGDLAGAARAFDLSGADVPERIAEDARFRRAVARARTGACDEVRGTLVAFGGEGGRRGAVARARAAECALFAGDLETAIRELRAVAEEDAVGVDTFATRLSLARALYRSGDAGAAVEELTSLVVDRAEHPDVEAVEAQLEALGAPLELDLEQRMARAERLIDQRRHADAVAELDAAGRPRDRDDRRRWLHLRGMALFLTRHHYDEAAEVLAASARLGGPTAEEDRFHAARALSRADRDAQAVRAYRGFVRRHPRHRRARLAEYLAAWLEMRLGRASGRRRMERFLEGPRARGGLRRNATWHLGFRALERGDHREAADRLERYARMGSGALVHGRGTYWLGRARLLSGDREGAAAAWREVVEAHPLHWYALLARARLEEAGEEPGHPFGDAPDPPREGDGPLPTPSLPEDVAFLASIGLVGDARAALRAREAGIRGDAPEGRGLETLVAAYRRLGDPARPYRLVAVAERAELGRRPDAANRWVWDAAYPRAFEPRVASAARAQGIPPELLWAIMRQESGYDPEAVSYADAIGLLQLLPRTSEQVATAAGIPFRRDMLFDPAWNLRLAARYVATLRERFGMPLAIAAYNAGGHRVREWLGREGEMELDRFLERIPIDQTRNYVRRVTSHLARYLYLADPAGGWPLDLPRTVAPPR